MQLENTVPVGHIDEVCYGDIINMLRDAKKVTKQLETANAKKQGIYDAGMAIGAKLQSPADAHATLDEVTKAIQYNLHGTAVTVGAPKRKEETADGKRYNLPQSFSNLKNVILFAFDNGISLTDDAGAVKSFTAVMKEKSAKLAAVKKETQEKQIAALTGVQKMRHDTMALLQVIAANVATADEAGLTRINEAIKSIAETPEQAKARKLHEANVTAAAKTEREANKAKAKAKRQANKSVGDELSKAA